MVTKSDCERKGKVFVRSHTTKDGTRVEAYCRDKAMINPAIVEINRNYRENLNSIKGERELSRYGTPTHGGYTLSIGQLQDYFRENDKRRR